VRGARSLSGQEKWNGLNRRPEGSEKAFLARPDKHDEPLAQCEAGRRVYRAPRRVSTERGKNSGSGDVSSDPMKELFHDLISAHAVRFDDQNPLTSPQR